MYPTPEFGSQINDKSSDRLSPTFQKADFNFPTLFPTIIGADQQLKGNFHDDMTADNPLDDFQHDKINEIKPLERTDSACYFTQDNPRLRGVFAYNRFFGQSHYMNSVYQVCLLRAVYAIWLNAFSLQQTAR